MNSDDMYGHLEESPKAIIEDLKGTPKHIIESVDMISFSQNEPNPYELENNRLKEQLSEYEGIVERLRNSIDREHDQTIRDLESTVEQLQEELRTMSEDRSIVKETCEVFKNCVDTFKDSLRDKTVDQDFIQALYSDQSKDKYEEPTNESSGKFILFFVFLVMFMVYFTVR